MNSDKHYNPAISRCLQTFAGQCDWQGLLSYLDTLSNAHYRTAGYMLGERILPTLDEENRWDLSIALVGYNAKAFLVTVLKALSEALQSGALSLRSEGSKRFLTHVRKNQVDTQKTLMNLLPVMDNPDDVQWLFRQVGVEEGEARLVYLLRIPTMPTSYALFHTLKFLEHDRKLLVRVAVYLIKRGDSLAFNLASLLKVYYDLEEVRGTFSLRIEPYQLARLDGSYEAFCQAMRH